VIEVGAGAGAILREIAGNTSHVYGVDLSGNMLRRAARMCPSALLAQADARGLPFPDSAFDVLYCSYVLDILPLADMPVVLGEFRRVLKACGRLVLVNLSKRDPAVRTWSERWYQWLPATWVPYLMGGCRPVLMESLVRQAGFGEVRRKWIADIMDSEIVTAVR
jgi:ubiquinone/menaquinone biosynthesis C-methylase UbiE